MWIKLTRLEKIASLIASIIVAIGFIYSLIAPAPKVNDIKKQIEKPPPSEGEQQVKSPPYGAGEPGTNDGQRRLQEFKALINRTIKSYPGKPNVALIVDARNTENGFSPANLLYGILRTDKIHPILNFFKEEDFKSKGYFRDIYEGNTELLRQAGALSQIDSLILGKLNYDFVKGAIDRDLVSCNINFSYKVINKNAEVVRSDAISVVGAGFSEQLALERALETLTENYSERILRDRS